MMYSDVLFVCVQKYSICSIAKKMTGVSATSLQWRCVTILTTGVIENLKFCVTAKLTSCCSSSSSSSSTGSSTSSNSSSSCCMWKNVGELKVTDVL